MADKRRQGQGRAALVLFLTLALASVSLAGCGGQRNAADDAEQQNGPGRAIVKFENIGNRKYVDAKKLAGLIGFHAEFSEDGNSLLIGDHDAFLTITAESRDVVKEERTLTMSHPAVLADGRMLVPSNELAKLFGEEALLTVDATQVAVLPKPAADDPDKEADFADDPAGTTWSAQSFRDAPASSDADELIREARRYLGVRYKFGAAHYSESKRFDCSSYVQYLYGKRGIKIPRTSRAQAKLGEEVPRDKLRKGDLLFFSVPGRVKNDKTVGHVGIYIGDQKMIHSCPLPQDGVQITDINKRYWKEAFLFAKRVL